MWTFAGIVDAPRNADNEANELLEMRLRQGIPSQGIQGTSRAKEKNMMRDWASKKWLHPGEGYPVSMILLAVVVVVLSFIGGYYGL